MLLFGEQSTGGCTDQVDPSVGSCYDHWRDLHGSDHERRVGGGEDWSDSRLPSLVVEPIGLAEGLEVGGRESRASLGLLA